MIIEAVLKQAEKDECVAKAHDRDGAPCFYELADCVEQAVLARLADQGPVAYLRKNHLRSIKRIGPMYGEISTKPRPDLVAVYVLEEKALEQHRAEFEAWVTSFDGHGDLLAIRTDGLYVEFTTQRAWAAWQAARGISE